MPNYIINKNTDNNGYNEVHTTDCGHAPAVYNQDSLGWFSNAKPAVSHAKNNGYPNADGCYYCCEEAHRG
mgnify:CR=1 FL=1